MEFQAIFTKTPRGISEVKNRAARLPRSLLSVLALIDGKSTLERLLRESKLSEMKFRQAIERLEEEGFIKACAVGEGIEETAAPVSRPRRLRMSGAEGLDELDFSAIARSALEEKTEAAEHTVGSRVAPASAPLADSPTVEARATAEPEARRIAEEALKAQAAAETKARADEEARVRIEAQARVEIEARSRMAAEAEARSKAEARARLEAHMKAEAERKARAEAERRADEERQARKALEARLEVETAARVEAEQKAREEAERKAKEETEARLAEEVKNREKAERRAREETERRAKEELETRLAEERLAREEAERRARAEAEQKAREEMEARLCEERKAREELAAQLVAEQRAKEEAEQRVREAVERKAQEEFERRAREEAERLAHEESERLAREAFESSLAAERRAREEAERRAAEEHELRQREDAERRAQEDADRKARAEAERRAAEEAEQRARVEAEHRVREEAERKMREELEANLAAERKAREDAERRAQEEAEARARKERDDAERQAREDTERAAAAEESARRQQEEAERQARAEAEAKALAEAQRKELEEAEHRAAENAAREREARDAGSPTAPESFDAPPAEHSEGSEPTAETDTGAEAAPTPQAEVAPFFEIDLDALDARERELRAEEEEKLKLEAERHAHELAARDEAERRAHDLAAKEKAARVEVARLEREAEETARRAAEEAERAAHEEEHRRVQEAERKRREEEERRLAEEALRRERAEAEDRMREEAERRDREEAAARAQAEAQRKAEQKLQKQRAKEEEKARKRAAAEEKARAREAARATAAHAGRGATRKAKWHKPAAVATALGIVAAIALVHLLPWDGFAPGMERLAASAVGEQVKIGSVRAGVFPSPHFKLEAVVIGKEQDAKIAAVRAVPELSSLFSDRKVLSRLELDSVTAYANVLRRLPAWVAPESTKSLRVSKVVLRNVKLEGDAFAVPPFGGEVGLDSAGAFAKAALRSEDGKLKVELRNKADGLEAEFTGRGWKPPFGLDIEFDEIAGKALARGTELTVSDLTARLYGGTATGHATLAWNSPWTLSGDFSVSQLDLATTLKAFTSQFRATGRLAASGRYTAQSASLDRLFADPVVEAGFKVERGEVENLDLTRALQQASAGTPVRGGKTQFAELSGTVKFSAKSYQYRQLALSSGILLANGSTDMVPSGDLAGRLSVELAARPHPIRALVAVSGKLSDPQLKASR